MVAVRPLGRQGQELLEPATAAAQLSLINLVGTYQPSLEEEGEMVAAGAALSPIHHSKSATRAPQQETGVNGPPTSLAVYDATFHLIGLSASD